MREKLSMIMSMIMLKCSWPFSDFDDGRFPEILEVADFLAIPRLLGKLLKNLRSNKSPSIALSVLRKVAILTESVKDALTENIKGSFPVYVCAGVESLLYDVS